MTTREPDGRLFISVWPYVQGVSESLRRRLQHSHRLQVRHDTSATLIATKGHRRPGQTRGRCLQDSP